MVNNGLGWRLWGQARNDGRWADSDTQKNLQPSHMEGIVNHLLKNVNPMKFHRLFNASETSLRASPRNPLLEITTSLLDGIENWGLWFR